MEETYFTPSWREEGKSLMKLAAPTIIMTASQQVLQS